MSVAAAEEIDALRDSVNRFMESEVNPFMNDIEKSGEFPRGLVKKAGDLGFYGAVFPESVGGSAMGYVAARYFDIRGVLPP
ncbi:MAG: acyl-CoA dehydrogenase family protein [Alphaproteobacteria bacterium]|jgi:alkylation response protein AidB-like acyl-CoA dehydrogenase